MASVSGFLGMCCCDIAITLSGLFCLKLLIKIRGQETILCPSREYGKLPENNFKKKEKKSLALLDTRECLSLPLQPTSSVKTVSQ